MPPRAAGSGRLDGPGAGFDSPGGRFLANEADRGPGYVRATGDRTFELESIFAPGTAFERIGVSRVENVGGGTLDIFRRADADDTADIDFDDAPAARGDGDTSLYTPGEIRARERSSRTDGEPVSPTPATPASGGGSTGGSSTGGGSGGGPLPTRGSGGGTGTGTGGSTGGTGTGTGSGSGGFGTGTGSGSGGTGTGTGSGSGGFGTGTGSGSGGTGTGTGSGSTGGFNGGGSGGSTGGGFGGGAPATPGAPKRPPQLDDPNDAREEEFLFSQATTGERFVNPIERLGDPGAGPELGEPPGLGDPAPSSGGESGFVPADPGRQAPQTPPQQGDSPANDTGGGADWHTRGEKELIRDFGGTPKEQFGPDGSIDGEPTEVRLAKTEDRFRINQDTHQELMEESGTYIFDDVNDNQPPKQVPAERVDDKLPDGDYHSDRGYMHKFLDVDSIF